MNRYQVIKSKELVNLIDRVNLEMSRSWQPIGGICVAQEGVYTFFYQALIDPLTPVKRFQLTAQEEKRPNVESLNNPRCHTPVDRSKLAALKELHIDAKAFRKLELEGGILVVKVGSDDRPASSQDIEMVQQSLRDLATPDSKWTAMVTHHAMDFSTVPKFNDVKVVI